MQTSGYKNQETEFINTHTHTGSSNVTNHSKLQTLPTCKIDYKYKTYTKFTKYTKKNPANEMM